LSPLFVKGHSSPAVSQILPNPPFSRRELPLLHPLEKGGKGGIWATSGNCHCFTPLEKGGERGGFEPQVGIAIASPPLRKGGKRGDLSHKWELPLLHNPPWERGERGDLSHKWEKGIEGFFTYSPAIAGANSNSRLHCFCFIISTFYHFITSSWAKFTPLKRCEHLSLYRERSELYPS
jgi:hypothetical protein